MKQSAEKPLALTMGDPSGIGLNLTISAWANREQFELPPFIFIGDVNALKARAEQLGETISITECTAEQAHIHFSDSIPAIDLPCPSKVIPGAPSAENASAVIQSIETAVNMTQLGQTSAVVTNPIAKSVLYEAGFDHPGHTEFLADLCKDNDGDVPLPVMMLAGPQLKTVPVTIHIPLLDILKHLTPELIIKTAKIAAEDLKTRFGIAHPRLAISGLNPHAGEGGALGKEDDALIAPAISKLQDMGVDAVGPLPADTMFHEDARTNYDVAICMYHDQALIPAKALGFHDAVNVTLGLPFIRTSPDHGTAFSIAGKKIARHDSLVAAMKLAAQMASFEQDLA